MTVYVALLRAVFAKREPSRTVAKLVELAAAL
jgi:hypothetical protein